MKTSNEDHVDRDALVVYRHRPGMTAQERLEEFLNRYGLSGDIPYQSDGTVDLVDLYETLPPEINDQAVQGENPARVHLRKYIEALPPVVKSRGVSLHPDHIITLLIERSEFFEELSLRLARVCRGAPKRHDGSPVLDPEEAEDLAEANGLAREGCQHYFVCPFKDVVAGFRFQDRLPCSYERKTIKRHVQDWITDPIQRGEHPKVDPRRPEIAVLFENALLLLILQDRYRLEMQQEGIRIPNIDTLSVSVGVDAIRQIGEVENPMVLRLLQLVSEYNKVLKAMGLEPNEMKKRAEWVTEDERDDLRDAVNQEARSVISIQARRLTEGMGAVTEQLENPALPEADRKKLEVELAEARGALRVLEMSERALTDGEDAP